MNAQPIPPSSGPPASGATTNGAAPTLERVRQVLDAIRPHVQADGGDIEFVTMTPEGIVQVRMHGSCLGCPSSEITLSSSIERNLKNQVPQVTGVKVVP